MRGREAKKRDLVLARCNLLHAVQRTAGLEPGDLLLIEGVVQLDLVNLSIGFDFTVDLLARGHLVQAEQRDLGVGLNLWVDGGTLVENGSHFSLIERFTLS